MMNSLFSSFDPSSSVLILPNWISLIIPTLLIPNLFWKSPNMMQFIINKTSNILHNEIKILTKSQYNGSTILFLSLFLFILINNFMGLFPFIFTSSSHMLFTLSFALPIWFSFIILGWINFTNSMFAHLVPSGTPAPLMSFMVVIETISNIIRPATLAIRLTANMIAGHLLLVLLGNLTASSMNLILPTLIMTQIALLTLETAVSMIQAYVFMVLTSLYLSEANPH